METQTPINVPELEWTALSRVDPQRSHRWYAIAATVLLLCSVEAILTGNWSFAIAILLAGGLYFLLRNTPPVPHRIRIEEGGVTFDGRFTRWGDCREFWLRRFPAHTELHILQNRTLNSEIVIQTADINPDLIRAVLSQLLPERSDRGDSLIESAIRYFKL